jgi:hypothetical protein
MTVIRVGSGMGVGVGTGVAVGTGIAVAAGVGEGAAVAAGVTAAGASWQAPSSARETHITANNIRFMVLPLYASVSHSYLWFL